MFGADRIATGRCVTSGLPAPLRDVRGPRSYRDHVVQDVWAVGDAYEAYVGRWSRRVAAAFLDRLDVPAGRRAVGRRRPGRGGGPGDRGTDRVRRLRQLLAAVPRRPGPRARVCNVPARGAPAGPRRPAP